MTDTDPKPKRRHWPWLVVGALLLFVVSWWNWPRGDARFVGSWTVWQPEVSDGAIGTMVLRFNGTGSFTGTSSSSYFSWSSRGDSFSYGVRQNLVTDFVSSLFQLTGGSHQLGSLHEFDVRSIERDTIQLGEHGYGGTETVLKRQHSE